MTNYKEILRFHSLGLNNIRIVEGCGCARSTVISTLRRAGEQGIAWNDVRGLSEIGKIEDELIESLTAAVESVDMERARESLWDALSAFAGEPFQTAKGLSYTYLVRGNELFFTRKEKSVTRASVNRAFDTALRLQREGVAVTGPKMLGCFGASYLYPVFIRIGVVRAGAAPLIGEDEKE